MTIDGTFETGATGWTATACTFAQDATQHHTGANCAKLTGVGTPTRAYARPTTAYTATPNTMHTLTIWVYSAAGCTNFRASIDWQTSAGVAISTDESVSKTIPAAAWTKVTFEAVAPSNATKYVFGPTLISPASGQIIFVDDIVTTTVTVTAVQDSAWPPRVIVSATGLLIGDYVAIFRHYSDGTDTLVRGAFGNVTDTALVVYDGEYLFGTETYYAVQINGFEVAFSTPVTYALPGGKVALSDPLTGLACETVITAWPEKANDRGGSQFKVGGRTLAVLPPRGGATQDVEFLTETETTRQQMLALLDGCTGGMILMRQPGGYAGVDGVYAVLADTEARAAQSGLLERRLFTLTLADVDTWSEALVAFGWTLGDIEDAYDTLTLADLSGDFSTLLDIETTDWGDLL